MSAKSAFLFFLAGFLGLSAAMMLVDPNTPQSLERTLGPVVETQKL
jgi:hypothetical protein